VRLVCEEGKLSTVFLSLSTLITQHQHFRGSHRKKSNDPMRSASRASQRFSRVLVLDKAIDALAEQHEEEEILAAIDAKTYPTTEVVEVAKTRLPPTDKGAKAYLFLLSAFTIEAIMWGKLNIYLLFYSSCYSLCSVLDLFFGGKISGQLVAGLVRAFDMYPASTASSCYRSHESSQLTNTNLGCRIPTYIGWRIYLVLQYSASIPW
jgi:hypothetical protein